LRRFGLALVRDNRLICDEGSAASLVDHLSRRAALAARRGDSAGLEDSRLRLFALFIGFYRRHVRMAAAEDAVSEFAPPAAVCETESHDSSSSMERAIRSLRLELRESLLLVVLERLSHLEAAEALDISLAVLIDRLARGRAVLAAEVGRRPAPASLAVPPRAGPRDITHLRLVK
jgi:DNA-directed RNA polymerase specialized sigma24 family protein